MCQSIDRSRQSPAPAARRTPPSPGTRIVELSDALSVARFFVNEPEIKASRAGFLGYGSTKPGDRVLLCTDTHYDPKVAEVISIALREKGATVDQIVVEVEPDREFTEVDEIEAMMRRGVHWTEHPWRYEGIPWVEDAAALGKHDLLIMGRGGPGNWSLPDMRYENIPWFDLRQLCAESERFPREVQILINRKLHEQATVRSRGGRIHLTDPEGTDIWWTNFEEYYDGPRYWDGPDPIWCHVMAHPDLPLLPKEDATGVLAGTICHYNRPTPTIKAYVEDGKLVGIEGGGGYGDAWRDLAEETRNVKYPNFPREGMFWLWEVAIGTNPKVTPEPPETIRYISSGGVEQERARSGIVHMGIGSGWRDQDEEFAVENKVLSGHLHVHFCFATMDIHTKEGDVIRAIDNGHLTALDDLEVRDLAARYGDPDELLSEAWTPKIPGINHPGDYERDYGSDPAAWIYAGKRDT